MVQAANHDLSTRKPPCRAGCCAPQACTPDGTVYDIVNIVSYIQKFKRHPTTGEPLALRDIITLNFAKNAEGKYHCPVLHKVGHAAVLSCFRLRCPRLAGGLILPCDCRHA